MFFLPGLPDRASQHGRLEPGRSRRSLPGPLHALNSSSIHKFPKPKPQKTKHVKIKKLRGLRTAALIAFGVFLGRGAQADTVLLTVPNTTPTASDPDGAQNNKSLINQGFGSYAAASSDAITVNGFGTPNIGLYWNQQQGPIGMSQPGYPPTQIDGPALLGDTQWHYYNTAGSVWLGVAQIRDSDIGCLFELTFIPNSASARVVVESFNFFPYYNSAETYAYNWSLVAPGPVGPTGLTNGSISFTADASTNHPVNIDYTGAPGQTLELILVRTGGMDDPTKGSSTYNIAVTDIAFAQTPATTLPPGPQLVVPPTPSTAVVTPSVPVTPTDHANGVAGANAAVAAVYYPYLANITNGATTLAPGSIKLLLDGSPVSPPPSISSVAGLTNVSYPGTNLLSSGTHFYALTYKDNLGAAYTNVVDFTSTYTTLPPAYSLPSDSGVVPGFTWLSVSASSQISFPTTLDSSIARAKAQLNGTLINTNTGMPYTNDAVLGPNADGSYNIATVLNFTDDGSDEGDMWGLQAPAEPEVQFPGLPFWPYFWFSGEALLYLDLPAGYHRFGVNSDDGFQVNALPPQGVSGSPIPLGQWDNSRGADNTLFDFLAPKSGIYSFQLIYFQSTSTSECEFFSVTNLTTTVFSPATNIVAQGGAILINDTNYPNAVISYLVLAPRIISIVKSGPNAVINWAYGTAPFQVQFTTNLTTAVWSNFGSSTTNRTATVPIQPGARFFRVFGQ